MDVTTSVFRNKYGLAQTRFLFVAKNLLTLADVVGLYLVYYFVGYMVSYWYTDYENSVTVGPHLMILIGLLWFLSAFIFKLYSSITLSSLEMVYRTTWRSIALYILMFALFFTLEKELTAPLIAMLFGFFVAYSIYLIVSRFLLTYIYTDRPARFFHIQQPIAVIGETQTAERLKRYFSYNNAHYVLFMDDIGEGGKLGGDQMSLNIIEGQFKKFAAHGIHEVYVCYQSKQVLQSNEVVTIAQKYLLQIHFVPHIESLSEVTYHTHYVGNIPVFSIRNEELNEITNRSKKRLFDIIFSLFVVLFVLSWLVPLIALLIRIESPGPVFFKQQRSGRKNKPFYCYKFRSMYVNAESDKQQASRGDKRITTVGGFLRKTSLDEFPQFLNVLWGDMSIVGPRPHMLTHTEYYGGLIEKYMARHYAKPGITGWAQVHGYRGETTDHTLMKKRVEHDLWYLNNWSLMLDVRIVFMTVINMLKRDKNAF